MNGSNNRLLEAALAYARLGWPIFPLAPGTKVPLKGTNGFEDATTDPNQIGCWWARWPAANIGLPPGAAGMVAIDLDAKGDIDGGKNWRDLKAEHGIDDDTLTSRTPSFDSTPRPERRAPPDKSLGPSLQTAQGTPQDASCASGQDSPGGRHLFFKLPAGANLSVSNRRLGPGIDVRGHRGYVVLPPSEIRGGDHPGVYRWEPGADPRQQLPGTGPRDRPPVLAPPPLVQLLAANDPKAGEEGQSPGGLPPARGDLPTAAGCAPYGRAALRSELDRLASTPKGSRNDRLNHAAFSLGQLVSGGHLGRAGVEAALEQAALQMGLGEREARATIKSGLDAGQKSPRSTPAEATATHPARGAILDPGGRPPIVLRGPPLPPVPRPSPADEPECPPLPPSTHLPPGLGQDACHWLDEYIAFSQKWSPRSFEGYHEACGLWLLSTVAARRVVVDFGQPRYTNLYLMLAGRTTMHAKSSATGIARATLVACGLDYLLAPDEATPQSFLRALSGGDLPPDFDELDAGQRIAARMRLGFCGQRGWYAEEFGSWLASMVRTDGVMADFRGLLRRFDDCPDEYTRSTIARGTEQVVRPYLALIGILTLADLRPLARKGTQLWGDGFLARFAFVTPPQDEVLTDRFPQGKRVVPAELTEPLVQWHRRLGLPRVTVENQRDGNGKPTGEKIVTIESPEPQTCDVAPDVEEALYRYNGALLEISRDSELTDLDGNYGRLHEKALRVAALLASLENEGRIELRHWARAQAIAEQWRLYTHRLYAQVSQPEASPAAEIEDKILAAIQRWQGTRKHPHGLTANEISRFVRGQGRAEVKFCADQLVAAGVLERRQVQGKGAERYWLPEPDEAQDR